MLNPQHSSLFHLDRAKRFHPSIFDILRFCGSPPAAEAASLIEKETL
jgi:hypothetical protein